MSKIQEIIQSALLGTPLKSLFKKNIYIYPNVSRERVEFKILPTDGAEHAGKVLFIGDNLAW